MAGLRNELWTLSVVCSDALEIGVQSFLKQVVFLQYAFDKLSERTFTAIFVKSPGNGLFYIIRCRLTRMLSAEEGR
jgi:hypothetical protein